MQKELTIVISAYNKERYLDRCICSLLTRSLDRVEIIVVNDGSSDRTSEIAHSYEARYPDSIVVVDKENGDQGSCINVGLKLFSGRYFKTLDADDYLDSTTLDEFVDTLSRSSADMVISGHTICGSGEREIDREILPLNVVDRKIYKMESINLNILKCPDTLGMHGVTYRGDVLRRCNLALSEHAPSTDTEYTYYPSRHCSTLQFLLLPLYRYQTGVAGQQSSQVTRSTKDGRYRVAWRMLTDYTSNAAPSRNIRESQRIVMNRLIVSYLECYILFFLRNSKDHARVLSILRIVRLDRRWWSEIIGARRYGIRFVALYVRFGICLYPITKILAAAKTLISKPTQ